MESFPSLWSPLDWCPWLGLKSHTGVFCSFSPTSTDVPVQIQTTISHTSF